MWPQTRKPTQHRASFSEKPQWDSKWRYTGITCITVCVALLAVLQILLGALHFTYGSVQQSITIGQIIALLASLMSIAQAVAYFTIAYMYRHSAGVRDRSSGIQNTFFALLSCVTSAWWTACLAGAYIFGRGLVTCQLALLPLIAKRQASPCQVYQISLGLSVIAFLFKMVEIALFVKSQHPFITLRLAWSGFRRNRMSLSPMSDQFKDMERLKCEHTHCSHSSHSYHSANAGSYSPTSTYHSQPSPSPCFYPPPMIPSKAMQPRDEVYRPVLRVTALHAQDEESRRVQCQSVNVQTHNVGNSIPSTPQRTRMSSGSYHPLKRSTSTPSYSPSEPLPPAFFKQASVGVPSVPPIPAAYLGSPFRFPVKPASAGPPETRPPVPPKALLHYAAYYLHQRPGDAQSEAQDGAPRTRSEIAEGLRDLREAEQRDLPFSQGLSRSVRAQT